MKESTPPVANHGNSRAVTLCGTQSSFKIVPMLRFFVLPLLSPLTSMVMVFVVSPRPKVY